MGNYLIFDGVDTSDYGLQISGEGTYTAPKREVEMIAIPGRNGEYALDKGRYENIEVIYPVANHEPDDMASFRTNMDDLRNELASRIGYKRLEDTFHPTEYRMATFKDGLEPKMVGQAMASEFDLVFNCKPQRFLKSGETEQTVTNGGTITNPTLFESQPLLLVDGYGAIDIEGQNIIINSTAIGPVEIASSWNSQQTTSSEVVFTPNLSALNTGDAFSVILPKFQIWAYGSGVPYTNGSISASWSDSDWTCSVRAGNVQGNEALYFFGTYKEDTAEGMEFTKGTNAENSYTWTATVTNDLDGSYSLSVTIKVKYSSGNITFSISTGTSAIMQANFQRISGTSSKSALGNVYIDCEIGEAYKIENDEIISVNNAVVLPANLPTLKPGSNTITFDNTVSSLKITPRWWKI